MEKEYSFGQRVFLIIASMLGPVLILLYGFTWRVRWSGAENLKKALQKSGRVLFVFWHSRLLGLCYTHRFRNIGIMVSKSFDGEWIARIVGHLGYRVFRGSASKAGAAALLEMIRSDNGGNLALTVDGPHGPAEKVKPGAIMLASSSGLPLVPITCRASRFWRLRSWDRFIVPKPFSTVEVVMGEPLLVPGNIERDDLEKFMSELENVINRVG
jgi:lysophospholipid acyltransferase (LPLAT)-like uncharacterized protein